MSAIVSHGDNCSDAAHLEDLATTTGYAELRNVDAWNGYAMPAGQLWARAAEKLTASRRLGEAIDRSRARHDERGPLCTVKPELAQHVGRHACPSPYTSGVIRAGNRIA